MYDYIKLKHRTNLSMDLMAISYTSHKTTKQQTKTEKREPPNADVKTIKNDRQVKETIQHRWRHGQTQYNPTKNH